MNRFKCVYIFRDSSIIVYFCYCVYQDETELCHVMQCLRGDQEGHAMDVEAFQRLLVTARAVAVARPQNLVRFANRPASSTADKEGRLF